MTVKEFRDLLNELLMYTHDEEDVTITIEDDTVIIETFTSEITLKADEVDCNEKSLFDKEN